MMNVSRYSASGTTQSNGIGATLALICAETVTSRPDAHPANTTQITIWPRAGAAAGAVSCCSARIGSVVWRLRYATAIDSNANRTNKPLQPQASTCALNAGSSTNGKLSNASNDPALDHANNQY